MMVPNRFVLASLSFMSAISMGAAAHAVTLVDEDFSTNPIGTRAVASDGSRFAWSAGGLTAAYDSSLPSARLTWNAGATLSDASSFAMSATFTIDAISFDDEGFAQIAFGLTSSATTGDNRTGYNEAPATYVPGDSYDVVSFDYFPNASMWFESRTLQPTVIASQAPSQTDALSGLYGPFGSESSLYGGDTVPTTGVRYEAALSYDAATRLVEVTLADVSGGTPSYLAINQAGGGGAGGDDADVTTIRYVLPAGVTFAVDQFGLLLWADGYEDEGWTTPGLTSLVADVTFERLLLTADVTAAPEPGALAGLLLGAVALVRRRG